MPSSRKQQVSCDGGGAEGTVTGAEKAGKRLAAVLDSSPPRSRVPGDREHLEQAARILDRLKAPAGAELLRTYAEKLPAAEPEVPGFTGHEIEDIAHALVADPEVPRECDHCLEERSDCEWTGGEEGGYICGVCRASTEGRQDWLDASLTRAHQNIEDRPEYPGCPFWTPEGAASTQPPSPQAEVQEQVARLIFRRDYAHPGMPTWADATPEVKRACRQEASGTGKQSPAEPQEASKVDALASGSTSSPKSCPEPQGDVEEALAKELARDDTQREWTGAHALTAAEKERYRRRARRILGNLTPLLALEVKERLEGLRAELRKAADEAAEKKGGEGRAAGFYVSAERLRELITALDRKGSDD